MYAFVDNPFIGDDSNGGEPGGNIRTAFLYRTDRVDLVDNSLRTIGVNGVSIDTPGSAGALDQQTKPDNPFFGSRPPLVATFDFNGNDVTIVNNHFTSKGGSGAVIGSVEPPLNASEVQRAAQAQAVNNFVDNLLAGDANAKVMVAGDLNEFPSEEPMSVLKGTATITNYDVPGSDPFDATATYVAGGTAVLHDLQDTLPANEQYDYVFDGSAQTLDHMLVTGNLAAGAQFDVVRINAEFADQTSDHDPLIATFDLPAPTTNYTLQLLHLSDGEAGLLAPQTAPNLAALVDAFDDDFANTLILAGGDDFLAGPFLAGGTDLSVIPVLNAVTGSTIGATTNVPIGAVDIAILNSIGVEASTIGNHEFDLGSRVLRDAFSPNLGAAGWVGAQFPYLSANLDFSGDADLNPRFTNTLDGGTGTLVPEASSLKGRIAPSAVITKGGEKIGLVAATTQLIEFDFVADRHGGERLSDRTRRQRRSRQHDAAGGAAAAHHQRADRRGREQDHPAVASAADLQRATACDQAHRRGHHPVGGLEHPPGRCGRRSGGIPGPRRHRRGPVPDRHPRRRRQDDADRQHRRRVHLSRPDGGRIRRQRGNHRRQPDRQPGDQRRLCVDR